MGWRDLLSRFSSTPSPVPFVGEPLMRVFYSDRQTVLDQVGFSPSARKPAEVVASWRRLGLPIDVVEPEPVTETDLALAHDPAYVRGVLACTIPNGFGNTFASVAASLPWTSGSLSSAAKYAIRTGQPAASPTSGFHHAGHGSGGGFCTFNGLMVTAHVLQRDGLARRVGILDCDEHYGNGTDEIIERRGPLDVHHYTFGGDRINPGTSDAWLARLPEIVAGFAGCDVILYQAGADPHIDDPLGGTLTTAQLARRDQIVFEGVKKLGIPIAWNLAGGYQNPLRKVLDIHDNTARACVAVFGAWNA